jgi:hypothetical protein
MQFSSCSEIEYLGAIDRMGAADQKLVQEMSHRLIALRRFDQNFCDADWHPRHGRPRWSPEPSRKAC